MREQNRTWLVTESMDGSSCIAWGAEGVQWWRLEEGSAHTGKKDGLLREVSETLAIP